MSDEWWLTAPPLFPPSTEHCRDWTLLHTSILHLKEKNADGWSQTGPDVSSARADCHPDDDGDDGDGCPEGPADAEEAVAPVVIAPAAAARWLEDASMKKSSRPMGLRALLRLATAATPTRG